MKTLHIRFSFDPEINTITAIKICYTGQHEKPQMRNLRAPFNRSDMNLFFGEERWYVSKNNIPYSEVYHGKYRES